jgi:prepilin-type processing-associated H-X9-DG protein
VGEAIASRVAAPLAARADDLTLADADAAGGMTGLDRQRHRGRLNVAFADGHVATLDTTPAVLRGVLLWASR